MKEVMMHMDLAQALEQIERLAALGQIQLSRYVAVVEAARAFLKDIAFAQANDLREALEALDKEANDEAGRV